MIERFWIAILLSCAIYSTPLTSADRVDFGFLLRVIQKTAVGKELLEKFVESDLQKLLAWGDVSHTDAIVGRSIASDSGKELHTRSVTVYVRKNTDWLTQAVELAHELVHAANPPEWGPYDEDLSVEKYIRSQIESKGGEYEALQFECKIKDELFALYPGVGSEREEMDKRCQPIQQGELNEFYKVGKYFQKMRSLTPGIENLSSEKPVILSAMGGKAYPVAMAEEYRLLNMTACKNTLKRVQKGYVDSKAESFLKKRCTL